MITEPGAVRKLSTQSRQSAGGWRAAGYAALLCLLAASCAPDEPEPAPSGTHGAGNQESVVEESEDPEADEQPGQDPPDEEPDASDEADTPNEADAPNEPDVPDAPNEADAPDVPDAADDGPNASDTAPPVRVEIDAIDVGAEVEGLGLRDDGTIEVPDQGEMAGWYRYGEHPGEAGPTVIGAHVDWDGEPGVFVDLEQLTEGELIRVVDSDGQSFTYEINELQQHKKDRFPTFDVYGTTTEDTLRLVTCAGPFDQQQRRHRDNLIVFADRVS